MRLIHAAICLALAVTPALVGCTSSSDEAPSDAAGGDLRSVDDHIVESIFDGIPSTNPEGTGVTAWSVFLVRAKTGEIYTVARGFHEDTAVIDVDLEATQPDAVAFQRLVSDTTYRLDSDCSFDVAKDLQNLARTMSKSNCKTAHVANALLNGMGAFLTAGGALVFCGITAFGGTVFTVSGCAGFGLATAVVAADAYAEVKKEIACDALPR